MDFKGPKFNNVFIRKTNAIIKRTEDNDLIVTKISDRASENTWTATFGPFSLEEKDEVLQTLIDTAGEELQFTDHESQIWLGYMITQRPTAVQIGVCNYQIEIEFDGEVIGVAP